MGIAVVGDGVGMGSLNRVPVEVALKRLHQFSCLSTVVTEAWLRKQMKKDVSQYSLLTGWLTASPEDWDWTFAKNTQALENALVLLRNTVSGDIWRKLCKKVRVPSNRAESKGTLAELSLAVFLVSNRLSFDMETQLNPPKDVDFSVEFDGLDDVHIEMQSLAESKASQRTSQASADWGGLPVSIDFKGEEKRVIGKVFDKTAKLSTKDITLVALDCTAIPEHGGVGLGTIPDALEHIFVKTISNLSDPEKAIQQLVDGVIWFQVDFNNVLQPIRRGIVLNQYSPHNHSDSLAKWVDIWSKTG